MDMKKLIKRFKALSTFEKICVIVTSPVWVTVFSTITLIIGPFMLIIEGIEAGHKIITGEPLI